MMIDEEKIPSWIEFACRSCGFPKLHQKISVEWSHRFTRRIADANYRPKLIRLSIPYWTRMDEAERRITIIHEVCHIIDDIKTKDWMNYKPHGKAWANLMLRCGEKPEIGCNAVDDTGLTRKYARVIMQCNCSYHIVSKQRHTRAERGQIKLFCRKCKNPLEIPTKETQALLIQLQQVPFK